MNTEQKMALLEELAKDLGVNLTTESEESEKKERSARSKEFVRIDAGTMAGLSKGVRVALFRAASTRATSPMRAGVKWGLPDDISGLKAANDDTSFTVGERKLTVGEAKGLIERKLLSTEKGKVWSQNGPTVQKLREISKS